MSDLLFLPSAGYFDSHIRNREHDSSCTISQWQIIYTHLTFLHFYTTSLVLIGSHLSRMFSYQFYLWMKVLFITLFVLLH